MTIIREASGSFKERKMRYLGSGSPWRLFAPPAVAFVLLFVTGCGDSGPTLHSVTGKITFDGQPVVRQTTTVVLKPIAPAPDQTGLEPVGKVDFEGNYTVFTGGRKGAPPGRYKVVVTAHDEHIDLKQPRPKRPIPNSLLPAKYASAQTTELTIEVVETPPPGAYDLELKK